VHNYRISGLAVASQLELPGAIDAPGADLGPDITVRLQCVPEALEGAIAGGPTWEMAGERVLLRVPRLARILIEAGRHIGVELAPGASERDASIFVLGTSFGILLHQRGTTTLHGAAVARDGVAMAICGASGAGKSTLATALCDAGFEFVADDICALGLDRERRPVVLPDGRQLKLWRESIDQLDVAAARQGEAVRDGFEKYYVGAPVTAAVAPALSAIYVLRDARPPLSPGIEPLNLPDAMRMLDVQAYRPGIRANIGSRPQKLAQSAAVLRHARAFHFTRKRGFEHIEAVVGALLAHWEGLRGREAVKA
jgi:hypothetical protein